jgi:hypothetical protein
MISASNKNNLIPDMMSTIETQEMIFCKVKMTAIEMLRDVVIKKIKIEGGHHVRDRIPRDIEENEIT